MIAIFWLSITAFSQDLILHNQRPPIAETPLHALFPWQTPTEKFFVRNNHPVPTIENSDDWTIEFAGMKSGPKSLSLKDLKSKKARSLFAVLQCSGNGRGKQSPPVAGTQWEIGAVGNAEWEGVSFAELLKEVTLDETIRYAHFEGADSPAHPSTPAFVRSVPIEKLRDESTLLAWKMNGENIPPLHGGPVRLVLPNWYGQNWIKWLKRVTFSATSHDGYVMKKSYRMPQKPVQPEEKWDSSTGDAITTLRVNSFIHDPIDGGIVKASAPIVVKGKAFSGFGPVVKLEYRINQSQKWTQEGVVLDPQNPKGGWQNFSIQLPRATQHRNGQKIKISVRATDAQGKTQPLKPDWNPSGYLYNAVQSVEFVLGDVDTNLEIAFMEEKCVTCHSWQMIFKQNLNDKGWEKTLNKMHQFGADLPSEKIKDLAKVLARFPQKYREKLAGTTYYSNL